MKKVNVFVDMDGVLAVYDKNILDFMYDENYFLNRPQIKPMIEIVRLLIKLNYNVFILTSCIDSPYCIPEKSAWLDKYLPEVKTENRIYVPHGTVKAEFAKSKVDTENAINVLIDDYTVNLDKWKEPMMSGALPIKVLNGINSTNGTWVNSGGDSIDAYSSVAFNVKKINNLIKVANTKLQTA